jgi:hypothetical protein
MAFIGNTVTTQGFIPAIDYFSGNGSTTAFTLSRPVASVAQVQAVIENVPQNPSTAFGVSGNTITFTSAPPSGTNNIYVYYTSPITQLNAVGQGTVSPSSLSTGGPSWDTTGQLTLPRNDTSNEGGQINFQRASDGTVVWSVDSYGSTSTPTLRFINGVTVAASLDGSNNFALAGGGQLRSNAVNTPVTFADSAGTQVGTLCRAWVNFNGTTSPGTIRASFNVSSVTKGGTGLYTVNFTNALSDANYAYEFSGGGAVSSGTMVYQGSTQTTTALTYQLSYPGTAQDATTQCVAIFR